MVTAKLIDQSYDKCYRITSSELVKNYHLSVNTPASEELKLVLKNLTITPAEAIAPIQINGESQVITYLEGENKISINKSEKSSVSPAGISVAKGAKLTIDNEPGQQGSIEVLKYKCRQEWCSNWRKWRAGCRNHSHQGGNCKCNFRF